MFFPLVLVIILKNMSIQITNSRIYTVPADSDSESDYEDYKKYTPKTKFISQEQENTLIKLGCAYNPLEEYRRSHLYKNPVSGKISPKTIKYTLNNE